MMLMRGKRREREKEKVEGGRVVVE